MESTRRPSAGPDMVVVLGISAIDVLCCALVCSLVLFLMLSQARSTGGAPLGAGTNKDLLITFRVEVPPGTPHDAWPVIRVRVFEPAAGLAGSSPAGKPLLFWGDQREVVLPGPDTSPSSNLVHPGYGQILWTSDDLREDGERLSVLQLHNPRPGQARIEVAYVDSASGLSMPASRTMRVGITIAGAVDSRFTLDLDLDGKACLLGAADCPARDEAGSISRSLLVLFD